LLPKQRYNNGKRFFRLLVDTLDPKSSAATRTAIRQAAGEALPAGNDFAPELAELTGQFSAI